MTSQDPDPHISLGKEDWQALNSVVFHSQEDKRIKLKHVNASKPPDGIILPTNVTFKKKYTGPSL